MHCLTSSSNPPQWLSDGCGAGVLSHRVSGCVVRRGMGVGRDVRSKETRSGETDNTQGHFRSGACQGAGRAPG